MRKEKEKEWVRDETQKRETINDSKYTDKDDNGERREEGRTEDYGVNPVEVMEVSNGGLSDAGARTSEVQTPQEMEGTNGGARANETGRKEGLGGTEVKDDTEEGEIIALGEEEEEKEGSSLSLELRRELWEKARRISARFSKKTKPETAAALDAEPKPSTSKSHKREKHKKVTDLSTNQFILLQSTDLFLLPSSHHFIN